MSAIILAISMTLAQTVITEERIFVVTGECPNGVCDQPAPKDSSNGIEISDAVRMTITACVPDGQFVGLGYFGIWLRSPNGKWVEVRERRALVNRNLQCVRISFDVESSRVNSGWQILAVPQSVAIKSRANKMRIVYSKFAKV